MVTLQIGYCDNMQNSLLYNCEEFLALDDISFTSECVHCHNQIALCRSHLQHREISCDGLKGRVDSYSRPAEIFRVRLFVAGFSDMKRFL